MDKQVIILEIDKEKDLYCPYNSDHELDDNITGYLVRKSFEKRAVSGVTVRIISNEKLDEATVRDAFDRWVGERNAHMKGKFRMNNFKQIWMASVSIGFIVLSLMLSNRVNNVLFTVLSTIGAFAMWEAAAISIVQNPHLRIQSRIIERWTKGLEIEFVVRDSHL